MSVIGKRDIACGPADFGYGKCLKVEGVALTASVLPGSLMAITATGLALNTAAATVFGQLTLFADRNYLQQKTVDDVWVQNENMVAIQPFSGMYFNVLVAAGNNITTRGTALTRNGAGLLAIAATDGTEEIICYTDEIVNVTANALVRVRIA